MDKSRSQPVRDSLPVAAPAEGWADTAIAFAGVTHQRGHKSLCSPQYEYCKHHDLLAFYSRSVEDHQQS